MLSTKQAALGIKIVSLILVALLSFFLVAEKVPETKFVNDSIESVEESSDTVLRFAAATLSASLAISAFPDDFATPLAESLSDMNVFFVAILSILFFEKILILYGVKLAFKILIPIACAVGIAAVVSRRDMVKSLGIRICVLALAVALVVPCSTHMTKIVAAEFEDYVEETIAETEAGADKLNDAMRDEDGDKTIFEKLSNLLQTAIHGISDFMQYFQDMIRKCMYAIASLILTNFLMPLLTFCLLKWVLKETFQLAIPVNVMSIRKQLKHELSDDFDSELVPAGEEKI